MQPQASEPESALTLYIVVEVTPRGQVRECASAREIAQEWLMCGAADVATSLCSRVAGRCMLCLLCERYAGSKVAWV